MGRRFLKDRSGKISGAIAALLAIVVILIYTRVASTPKGSEDAFYFVYGSLKWLLKTLDLLKYITVNNFTLLNHLSAVLHC